MLLEMLACFSYSVVIAILAVVIVSEAKRVRRRRQIIARLTEEPCGARADASPDAGTVSERAQPKRRLPIIPETGG